ncbi:MAG: ABC transporter permease [Planctomycetales bacterium]|nr:ABC transporter permease [Planctomycetales bacterium]
MRYVVLSLVRNLRKHLSGVLAVALTFLLIEGQIGVTTGLVSLMSWPIDHSEADIWIAAPGTTSCDTGGKIRRGWENQARELQGVAATDSLISAYYNWRASDDSIRLIMVLGCSLSQDALGPANHLAPGQQTLLTQPDTVIVNQSDQAALKIRGIGDRGTIGNLEVRVVDFTTEMPGVTGPYVICSQRTARRIFRGFRERDTTFVLVKCRSENEIKPTLSELEKNEGISCFQSSAFSLRTRLYCLSTTKAGIALTFIACLGTIAGGLVLTDSLYTVTMSEAKQFAVLRALGVSLMQLRSFVLKQSFLVWIAGTAIGIILVSVAGIISNAMGVAFTRSVWSLVLSIIATSVMSAVAGLLALRSLSSSDPNQLLR